MVKSIKWISVLVLLSVISGCTSYSSTTLEANGKGNIARTTINGKPAVLKDCVFTYGDKTFEVPDRASVRIERRNDNTVRIYVDGKFVYEDEDDASQSSQ